MLLRLCCCERKGDGEQEFLQVCGELMGEDGVLAGGVLGGALGGGERESLFSDLIILETFLKSVLGRWDRVLVFLC